MTVFFISPHGDDRHPGTESKPFATLVGARDAIRALKKAGNFPADGVVVMVRPGEYAGMELAEEDSGPVTYRATERGQAIIHGGCDVTAYITPAAPELVERLDPDVRAQVLQIDLRAAGITEFGTIKGYRRGRQWDEAGFVTAPLELFVNGQPLTLARWPNRGSVIVAGVPNPATITDGRGSPDPWFHYAGDRPARWRNTGDLWMRGFWTWDFNDESVRIKTIIPEKRLIEFDPAAKPSAGVNPGQSYYYYNVFEELDQPGEYYVDRESGRLFFLPPLGSKIRQAFVSLRETPVLSLRNVSHVRFEGFEIMGGRSHGVEITGGSHCVIAGSVIRNVGGNGVMIQGGSHHVVDSCDIYNCGDGGIFMDGGDRHTLTPGGHVAVNNDIHRLGRWKLCYRPAVNIYGCGLRVANNRIHDLPHCGILFHGNDHVIENNEIYRVALESADVGAIYFPGNFAGRGNVIRGNFIHHVGQPDYLCMGVYLDDLSGGVLVAENIFYRVQRAVNIHGGRDIRITNNYFIECEPGICVGLWAGGERSMPESWKKWLMDGPRRELETFAYMKPPWSERYPELASLNRFFHPDRIDYIPPENLTADRNIFWGGTATRFEGEGQPPVMLAMTNNLTATDPRFSQPDRLDFRLLPDSPALSLPGFRAIDVSRIGLYTNQWRRALPAREVRDFRLTAEPPILTIRNNTDIPYDETISLVTVPVQAEASSEPVRVQVDPWQSRQVTLKLPTLPGGSYRLYAYGAGERWPLARAKIVIKSVWLITAISKLADLAECPPQNLCTPDGQIHAQVRLALMDTDLAIRADITDPVPVRVANFWEGSCFEFYVSPMTGSDITQLVALPGAGDSPPAFKRYRGGAETTGWTPSNWEITGTDRGYRLVARVPMAELGLTPNQPFRAEAAVSVAHSKIRVVRFDSYSPYLNNEKFCTVQIAAP